MQPAMGLSTGRIIEIAAETLRARDGALRECFDDRARLFIRAVLPNIRTVRPDDEFQEGLALRATHRSIWVHPYVLRLVCTNGTVMGRPLGTEVIERIDEKAPEVVEASLREAIHSCCREGVFEESFEKIKRSDSRIVDYALSLLPFMTRVPEERRTELFQTLMRRIEGEGDGTAYGLMNGITSIAREEEDPGIRWSMEEYGGEIAFGNYTVPAQAVMA